MLDYLLSDIYAENCNGLNNSNFYYVSTKVPTYIFINCRVVNVPKKNSDVTLVDAFHMLGYAITLKTVLTEGMNAAEILY